MLKIKEVREKKKGRKKKTWPATSEELKLLFGLINVKVISRDLGMVKLSKEHLIWWEVKMSKLDVSESKLKRDGSPILFPCKILRFDIDGYVTRSGNPEWEKKHEPAS